MPSTENRFERYQDRRQHRLSGRSELRSRGRREAGQVWYRADEVLVVEEERQRVERHIAGLRRQVTSLGDEEVVPGLRRYLATGLDVSSTVRAVQEQTPAGARVVCPNHVFLSTPFNHGGPFGPPLPVAAGRLAERDPRHEPVSVAIIDTGVWADSRVPRTYYRPGAVDIEWETDVDEDGLLDGDVGHANFIAGIIVSRTRRVELSVLKVLDTFGVCTEDQLVRALGRLDDDVQVVNLSLGGYTEDDQPPLGLRMGLERALQRPDRVVVAAAGNDGIRTRPFWPAAFTTDGQPWSDRIAAVAAHDGGVLCDWSNAGSWVTLAAAGQDVRSTYIDHDTLFPSGWAQWSGTSFATPRVVAEVAARIARGMSAPAALARVVEGARVAVDDQVVLA